VIIDAYKDDIGNPRYAFRVCRRNIFMLAYA
jgi:hypothetical protein